MAKLDFLYFGSRYGYLVDAESKVVLFTPNIAQMIILHVMGKMEESGIALMLQFLKARQLGITLLFQMILAQRVAFYRNVNAVMASADPGKSRAMAEKLEFVYDNMPWWIRPRRTGYRVGELIEYADLNSGVSIQWGNQMNGIARGITPTMAHLSEVAEFERPEELIESSLMRALHENPFALLGLEGTAEVMGDWWNETWDYNVKMDAHGLARLKPMFLPWFIGRDLYPTEAWLRRRPVPEGWDPPDLIKEHAAAAAAYVGRIPYLSKFLGREWTMPLSQRWFYYLEYMEFEHRRRLPYFLREMPANPDEAWQNANPTVFELPVLQYARRRVEVIRPEAVYGIRGPSIPIHLFPPDAEGVVDAAWQGPLLSEDFELIPYADRRSWDDPAEKLYVWEGPLEGEEYGIGVDPSEGVGEDLSVVQVVKKATPDHPDIQVAEWASNRVNQYDLWAYVLAIITYYAHGDGSAARVPKAVIEVNIAAGDATQTELLKRGFSNFHVREDLTVVKPARRIYTPERQLLGFKTNSATRPKIVGLTRNHIRDRRLLVHSSFLVREMSTLVWNRDKQRIEAASGQHDDRFMAIAVLLGSWYDPSLYGERVQAWEERRLRDEIASDHPSWGDHLPRLGTPKSPQARKPLGKGLEDSRIYG